MTWLRPQQLNTELHRSSRPTPPSYIGTPGTVPNSILNNITRGAANDVQLRTKGAPNLEVFDVIVQDPFAGVIEALFNISNSKPHITIEFAIHFAFLPSSTQSILRIPTGWIDTFSSSNILWLIVIWHRPTAYV